MFVSMSPHCQATLEEVEN